MVRGHVILTGCGARGKSNAKHWISLMRNWPTCVSISEQKSFLNGTPGAKAAGIDFNADDGQRYLHEEAQNELYQWSQIA